MGLFKKLAGLTGKVAGKIGKKGMIIAASTIAGVAVTGTGTLGVVANLPKNVFVQSVFSGIEDVLERDEIEPIVNMLKQGSLKVSLSKMKEGESDYLDGQSYAGKLYFSKKGFALEDLKLDFGDLEIQGSAYLSQSLMYVNEKNILGGAYGITKKSLADDFADSIFAYNKSEYSIPDEDLYDALIDALDDIASSSPKKETREAKAIIKKYTKKMWKILSSNAEFDTKIKKEKLNREEKSVRVVTMTLDGKAMSRALEDVYEFLSKDDDLIDFLEKYEERYAINYIGADERLGEPTSIVEEYEMILDKFEDNLDVWCDNLEDNFEDIAIEVVTPVLSSKLLKLTISQDGDDMFMVDFGKKGAKNTDKITVEEYYYYYGRKESTKYVYEIKKDNAKAYESNFKVDNTTIFTVDINRQKDKFEVEMDGMIFKGNISTKNKATTIALNKIASSDGYTQISTDLTIVLDQKDKLPAAPKNYKTIANISEETIDKIYKNVISHDGACDICGNESYSRENGVERCYNCDRYGYDDICDYCQADSAYRRYYGSETCYNCYTYNYNGYCNYCSATATHWENGKETCGTCYNYNYDDRCDVCGTYYSYRVSGKEYCSSCYYYGYNNVCDYCGATATHRGNGKEMCQSCYNYGYNGSCDYCYSTATYRVNGKETCNACHDYGYDGLCDFCGNAAGYCEDGEECCYECLYYYYDSKCNYCDDGATYKKGGEECCDVCYSNFYDERCDSCHSGDVVIRREGWEYCSDCAR